MIKILDIASTNQGAYRLLKTRVAKINKDDRFINYIVCPKGEYSKAIMEEGIDIIEIDMSRGLNVIQTHNELKILIKLLLDIKPDIVHSHNSKSGALARLAVEKANKLGNLNIKMIHQVHGYHFTNLKGIRKQVFKKIEVLLSKKTDIILFQNKYELNISEKLKMNKHCKLYYIGNGVNIEEFKDKIENTKNFDEEVKNIICIARIETIKNHAYLIEAINLLKNIYNFEKFKVYLIGEGKEEFLLELINKYDLQEFIKFEGEVDRKKIIQFINDAHISVLTSYKEGKPRALMESMILGTPCIGTNVIGTNEVIVNEKTGFLVDLNHPKLFAEKLFTLLDDKKMFLEFSQNSKKYALENFNEDLVIDKLKELYLNCVQR